MAVDAPVRQAHDEVFRKLWKEGPDLYCEVKGDLFEDESSDWEDA